MGDIVDTFILTMKLLFPVIILEISTTFSFRRRER